MIYSLPPLPLPPVRIQYLVGKGPDVPDQSLVVLLLGYRRLDFLLFFPCVPLTAFSNHRQAFLYPQKPSTNLSVGLRISLSRRAPRFTRLPATLPDCPSLLASIPGYPNFRLPFPAEQAALWPLLYIREQTFRFIRAGFLPAPKWCITRSLAAWHFAQRRATQPSEHRMYVECRR